MRKGHLDVVGKTEVGELGSRPPPPPRWFGRGGEAQGLAELEWGCKLHWAYSMESLDARVVIRPSQLLISSPIFERRGLMLMEVEERQ